MLLAAFAFTSTSHAVDYTWDPDNGTAGVQDGSGIWDKDNTVNWITDGGTTNEFYPNGGGTANKAIFGTGAAGTAGTITLDASGGTAGVYVTGAVEFNEPFGGGEYTLDLDGNTLRLRRTTSTIIANSDATITGGTIEIDGSTSAFITNNGSTLNISSVIGDRIAPATLGASWTGGANGTLVLSGANTFTGALSINRTTVSIDTIGLKGATSNAGAGNEVQLRALSILKYTGSGSTTDRDLTLTSGNGGREIRNDGTGALNWTSGTFTNNNTTDNNLVLGGTYTGAANTLGVDLTDNGANPLRLEKNDASTWSLTGTNTYTGGTNINSGTLEIQNSGALGTGLVNLVNAGTPVLEFGADGLTLANDVRISNQAGTRTIRLDSGGAGHTGTLSGQLDIRRNTAGEFVVDVGNTDTLTVSQDIVTNSGGGAGLTKNGDGTLIIEAESTYAGATTVNGGTLRLLSDEGNVSLQSNDVFAVNNGSTLVFDNDAGNFVVGGSNDVTFDSSGGNTLSIEGTPIWRNASIVTTGGARNFVSGGVLNHQNGNDVIFDVASGTDGDGIDLEVSTQLDRGGIIKNGGGTVLLTNGNNRMIFNRELTINGGTLELGGSSRISTYNNPGTDFNEVTGPVNLNDASSVFKHSSSLDQELSGIISGTGSIVKDGGAGTLTLSGANTYQGNTTVNAGTLVIDGTHTGGAQYTVNAGGTLAGSGSFDALVEVNGVISPGNSPGTMSTGTQTWNDGGSYLWEINDTVGWPSGAGKGQDPGWDWMDITGTLELGGLSAGGFTIDIDSLNGLVAGNAAGFDVFAIDGYESPFDVDYSFVIATASGGINGFNADNFNLDFSGFSALNPEAGWHWEIIQDGANDLVLQAFAVPEPSSTALLGLGGLALMLRRKRSAA